MTTSSVSSRSIGDDTVLNAKRSAGRFLTFVTAALALAGCTDRQPPGAAYVGGATCATCHAAQAEAWAGSHHDLAMQPATAATVLGNFDDALFALGGDTTEFFRRDGRFFVRSPGADGVRSEFEVTHTFGVDPLQQYLIPLADGRYQAFDLAWDARPAIEGGQTWFHLYPERRPRPGESLHWTGIDQSWNYQCAECHSTDLRKGYDPATNAYETTWSEIDVSCEACHGPGSRHVEIAEAGGTSADENNDTGWGIVGLGGAEPGTWRLSPGDSIARRSRPLETPVQVETCGRCHSRRGVIDAPATPGQPLLDTHRPAMLNQGLYHADGQNLDEVYVYGSFLQSRMHAAGVTCTDCHDPHRATLKAEGNAVCATCHLPTTYDIPGHTMHSTGSPGAACVDCHMPARTYMVVDPRRDHGLRVPRPDLSAELGVPEPCTACHTDRSPSWAADRVAEHFGAERTGTEFARAFSDAREGDPRVVPRLAAIVGDAGSAGIVRATAASLLGQFQHPDASPAIDLALRDADPLVRLGGLDAVTASRASTHWRNAFRLLSDSLLAIRVEAARALAPVPPALLSEEEGRAVGEAIEAYVASQLVTADRPETHLNIGAVLMARGELERAEQAFARAIELDPTFGAGYVNAADLYRSTGRESDALAILVRGLEAAPEEAALHHALGLALVRQQRVPDALIALSRASELEPENGRFAFVYAIGLNSTGEADRSLEVMTNALESSPYDRELLSALVTVARDAGHVRTAISYAQRVAEVWAFDPTAAELLQAVTGARP